jgi:rubrerythrin
MPVKGTRTERNLLTAFAGESQARNRYSYFAKQAQKDGFEQIAAVFTEIAEQERVHAKEFFKRLEGGKVEVRAAFPAGVIGSTQENLKAAADGEKEEWGQMYPDFAAVAREEGLPAIAQLFEFVAVAEKQHEARYRRFLSNLEQGRAFKREQPVRWRCRNCGYVHEGPAAPGACPACTHPQAFFEVLHEEG